MDFMRALSVLFVVVNIYWFCYPAIREWNVSIGVVDRILLNFQRTTGLFGSILWTKLFSVTFLALSCLGTKGVKEEKIKWAHIWTALSAGVVLFFFNWWLLSLPVPLMARTAFYILTLAVGYLCLLAAGGTAVYFYLLHRRHRREASAMQERESELLEEADRKAREMELKRYRTTRLSEEECRRLHRKLEGLMKSERPFTNPDLKSGDLAAMIGSSAHALSFLFNQHLHKNYYDYVNEYRVAEFKRLVGELDTSRYTLTAMSQMCGFSSRASFFRHFKNLTGITPADYLKSLKK